MKIGKLFGITGQSRSKLLPRIFATQSFKNSFIKKTTLALFGTVVFLFVFAPVTFAIDTGISYGTYTGLSSQDIRITIMKIVRVVLGFVGVIALVIVIYAGYVWMTSGGNPERIDRAKKTLRNAAIGLVIILLAFSIVSFIIGALNDIFGPGGGNPGPPSPCTNCGHLGNGIIESVYPVPGARDVARNTNIIVRFKVVMDPSTIMDTATCSGSPAVCNLLDDSVLIYPESEGPGAKLSGDQVQVSTSDNKTFIFHPLTALGSSSDNTWYETLLTSDIQKDNGQSAFTGAFGSSFAWTFEVGTFLDLDTPEISGVFPEPDNAGDLYSTVAATQATGAIQISGLPKLAQVAGTDNLTSSPGAPSLSIAGSYNCQVNSFICVNNVGGQYEVHPKAAGSSSCTGPDIVVPGLITNNLIYQNQSLNIGCGLTLSFDADPVAGNGWTFDVVAGQSADTLLVGSQAYSFVDEVTAASHIEVIPGDLAATINNIVAKIVTNNQVTPSLTGTTINLISNAAGVSGNSIALQSSGSWANITPMSGGSAAELNPTIQGIPDKARNAVITIDFNEAINPIEINENTIRIEFDADPGAGQDWQSVPGTYNISNQYKTVEFLPEEQCEIDGVLVQNACGDPIFCLPVNDPEPYQATAYRITISAGELQTCVNAADCLDSNFNSCEDIGAGPRACRSASLGVFYPGAAFGGANGIIDAANNSFNGNSNNYVSGIKVFGQADGPGVQNAQGDYSLNSPSATQGDNLVWTFYVNKDIKLSPPVIEDVNPFISSAGASVADSVRASYGDLLQSSTLKPGRDYNDGLCGCVSDSQCNQAAGEVCDQVRLKCVNSDSAQQQYCLEDDECAAGFACHNKKYVSLIDTSGAPVAWWVTKEGVEVGVPDGYDDKNNALISHTTLLEATIYGSEYGSGIKDIYQNCYLPSEGPGFGTPSCNTSKAFPYCCNGQALTPAEWADSVCFTDI